jgi:hypothetical protein
MEGVAAAGAYAGAAIAGSKATQAAARTAAQGTVRAVGASSQAAGAVSAVKQLGGTGRDQAASAAASFGQSAKQGAKSLAHSLGRSLYAGSPSSGSSGPGGPGTNRYSQTTRLNEKTAEGHSKNIREYAGERFRAGEDIGLNRMVAKEEKQKNSQGAKP